MASVEILADSTLTGPILLNDKGEGPNTFVRALLKLLKPKISATAPVIGTVTLKPYGEPEGLAALYIVVGILALALFGLYKLLFR